MVRLVYPWSHFQVDLLIHLLLDLISAKVRRVCPIANSLTECLTVCTPSPHTHTPPRSLPPSPRLISLPTFQQRFGFILVVCLTKLERITFERSRLHFAGWKTPALHLFRTRVFRRCRALAVSFFSRVKGLENIKCQ